MTHKHPVKRLAAQFADTYRDAFLLLETTQEPVYAASSRRSFAGGIDAICAFWPRKSLAHVVTSAADTATHLGFLTHRNVYSPAASRCVL